MFAQNYVVKEKSRAEHSDELASDDELDRSLLSELEPEELDTEVAWKLTIPARNTIAIQADVIVTLK